MSTRPVKCISASDFNRNKCQKYVNNYISLSQFYFNAQRFRGCVGNCFGLFNMCTKRRGGFALICLLFICSQLPVYYCLCYCFAFDCPKPLFVNLFWSVLQLFSNIHIFNWYFSSHIFFISNGVKLMEESKCLFMRKRLQNEEHMWYIFYRYLIRDFIILILL